MIVYFTFYAYYCFYTNYCISGNLGWLESIGSQVVYELYYKKPILYVIPIESVLGKLPVFPVCHTGTIQHHLHNVFPGAPGDCLKGAGDGCMMCFI